MTDFTDLVRQLTDPAAYPERPEKVDIRETHISVVFLTGKHAYKIKKPLDQGFLDFTTLEKRKLNCEREVTLNRRFSPHVYEGVVPIVREGDGVRVEGEGEAVEYAVKMAQLPEEGMLDHLVREGNATEEMMRQLAREIAAFHARAVTSAEIARQGGLDTVRDNVEDNFARRAGFPMTKAEEAAWQRAIAYSRAFMERRAHLFRRREAEGYIRDCHGDLHTAQVCFHDGRVTILDCIEFNDLFRYGDVVSDIAFLAMDLEFCGRKDLSHALVRGYLEETRDWEALELLPFYKTYRACVRGKIEGLRMRDPDIPEEAKKEAIERGRRYYILAGEYARGRVDPALVLIGGLMGTGKTTLAEALEHACGLAHLSSDVTRKRLAGLSPEERRHVAFGADIYEADTTARTYAALLDEAKALLAQGRSVVVDASFRDAHERSRFYALAQEAGAPFLFALCTANEDVIRQRLTERVRQGTGPSDGRWEIYQRQKALFQEPHELPPDLVMRIDTARPVGEAVKVLLAKLVPSLQ